MPSDLKYFRAIQVLRVGSESLVRGFVQGFGAKVRRIRRHQR